jgi:hypothetical protein
MKAVTDAGRVVEVEFVETWISAGGTYVPSHYRVSPGQGGPLEDAIQARFKGDPKISGYLGCLDVAPIQG